MIRKCATESSSVSDVDVMLRTIVNEAYDAVGLNDVVDLHGLRVFLRGVMRNRDAVNRVAMVVCQTAALPCRRQARLDGQGIRFQVYTQQ